MLKTQNRCKDPTFFEASTVREESIPVFMSIRHQESHIRIYSGTINTMPSSPSFLY